MKGGNVCNPCSEESKKSNENILISLKNTQELINKSQELCSRRKGLSLKTAATAVVAANRIKKISETKKSIDPTHWHLYENDSGKYWENGNESEAFWVSDVGDIVPSGWTAIKDDENQYGLHYFEKAGGSRWYLTTDEIGEENLDKSKKWFKAYDKNKRAYWKKHTNDHLWEVRWVNPKNDYEKQIAKEYKIGDETKYEREMTRADVDTWVQQFGDNVTFSVERIANKLRNKSRNKSRQTVNRPKKKKKSFEQQLVVGGKRRTKKRRRKYHKKTKKRRRKYRKKTKKRRRKSRKKKTRRRRGGAQASVRTNKERQLKVDAILAQGLSKSYDNEYGDAAAAILSDITTHPSVAKQNSRPGLELSNLPLKKKTRPMEQYDYYKNPSSRKKKRTKRKNLL